MCLKILMNPIVGMTYSMPHNQRNTMKSKFWIPAIVVPFALAACGERTTTEEATTPEAPAAEEVATETEAVVEEAPVNEVEEEPETVEDPVVEEQTADE